MIDVAYFQSQDYRQLIELAFADRSQNRRITYAAAAEHCQVQATYFSNVLKGRADFNDDQIFSLCDYLSLNELESRYLKTCHQWSRSGLRGRKVILEKEIRDLRQQALSPAARFEVTNVEKLKSEEEILYHLDPMHHILALCIDACPQTKDLGRVQEQLGLSSERLHSLLENLTRSGRVKIEKSRFHKAPLRYHLGSESEVLFYHQAHLRQMSVDKMRQMKREEFKAFSVTFGSPKKNRAAIEEILTKALEKIRKVTEDSGDEDEPDSVFQINLDFFPWFMAPARSKG